MEALPAGLIPTARKLAQKYDVRINERPISFGPMAWFFTDEDNTLAFRLGGARNLPYLHKKMANDTAVIQEIRRCTPHVPTQSFLGEPELIDGYVTTVSPFLPGRTVAIKGEHAAADHAAYGRALQAFHKASAAKERTHHALEPFNPVLYVKRAFMHMQTERNAGRPLRVGNTTFPEPLYSVLDRLIKEAEDNARQLVEASTEPHIDILFDITPGNALIDPKTNEAVTIDNVELMMRGPRIFDLARLPQWATRFGRPAAFGEAMLLAYEEQAGEQIDRQQLTLASKITEVSHGMFGLVKVTELPAYAREGVLIGIIDRLTHIDDPTHLWESDIATKSVPTSMLP